MKKWWKCDVVSWRKWWDVRTLKIHFRNARNKRNSSGGISSHKFYIENMFLIKKILYSPWSDSNLNVKHIFRCNRLFLLVERTYIYIFDILCASEKRFCTVELKYVFLSIKCVYRSNCQLHSNQAFPATGDI